MSSSSSSKYSIADGGYIDSETQKTSDQQQEIVMPEFNGKIIQWFQKAGDHVSLGDPILCVESLQEDEDGFRVNLDIPSPKSGYLAARYKLEGDLVDARHVLAVLVPDRASLENFVHLSPENMNNNDGASEDSSKPWWSTPYEPGRPDPFAAKSPLGADDGSDGSTSATRTESAISSSQEEEEEEEVSPTVIGGSAGKNTFTGGGFSKRMIEIQPSPADPFQSPKPSSLDSPKKKKMQVKIKPSSPDPFQSKNNNIGGRAIGLAPAFSNDNYDYGGQQETRPPSRPPFRRSPRMSPPQSPSTSSDTNSYPDIQKRRNTSRGSISAVPVTYNVQYADATRLGPTSNLKNAAVPTYGSDGQSHLSNDDEEDEENDGRAARYAGNHRRSSNLRELSRKNANSPVDADVISSPSSYGSDVQSSIPDKTAFFQRPPINKRRRRRVTNNANATFHTNGDRYSLENPSIQSVIIPRTSLPSQSAGSMSLSENSLPTRSNLGVMDEMENTFFFQSDNEATTVDFVNFLETRGMRDSQGECNVLPVPMQNGMQPQQEFQHQSTGNSAQRRSIITRAKNRALPTKYDIAASTLGGSLLGASIGIAGVANPELGLDIGQSVLIPPVLWATMIGTIGYAGGIADNDAGYSVRHVFSLGGSLKSGLKSFVHSARQAVEKTANAALRMVSGEEDPPMRVHHITIKTEDIVSTIDFYSLLGFKSVSKFRIGQARASWLDNVAVGAGRIELIEVPSERMQQEGGNSQPRALDRVQNQELLGWNHVTLDLSDFIRKKGLSSLSEYLGHLNDTSKKRFGKGLRLAMEPQKQAVDNLIYDTAFLFDPDGVMIQLQYRTNERVEDYRTSPMHYDEPTGGQGLVDRAAERYQSW